MALKKHILSSLKPLKDVKYKFGKKGKKKIFVITEFSIQIGQINWELNIIQNEGAIRFAWVLGSRWFILMNETNNRLKGSKLYYMFIHHMTSKTVVQRIQEIYL